MNWQIASQPEEPITLTQVKNVLHILHDDDDVYLTSLITSARQWAESHCLRQILSTTINAYADSWESLNWKKAYDVFSVPRGQLLTVTSLSYIASGGTDYTTISSGNYRLLTYRLPGDIQFDSSYSFPGLETREDAIKLVYTAGFGTETTDIPLNIRQSIMMYAAYLYAHDEVYLKTAYNLIMHRRIKNV